MAVTLWIRRARPITRVEWEATVDADPRLGRQAGFALGDVQIPGTFYGPLRNGHVLPVFSLREGEISFNFRALGSDGFIEIVADLCAALEAFIEDEAGDRYDLSAQDGLVARSH